MFDKNFVSSELPEIGAFSFSKDVMNEGDFAQISCIVTSGDQPLTIFYTCLAKNMAGTSSYTTELKVNGIFNAQMKGVQEGNGLKTFFYKQGVRFDLDLEL